MKAPHVLYGLILLTIISILAGVISSATNTHTTQAQPKKSVLSETTASQGKKKTCGCCIKRMARVRKQMQKIREHRLASQQTEAKELVLQQTPSHASDTP
ncbi:MAG: hypothetical protein OXU51_13435 [Candidatus Poribacteria bacterium]|nr:hypothetical protein [Candidatus Poribacteria bacterium]